MKTQTYIRIAALIFTIIGALNWGFFGIKQLDLVAHLFGVSSSIARAIYMIVGISGVYLLTNFKKLL